MTAASEHPLLYDRPQKLNVPQLKEVAQEVEDTIVKIMKEAPSG
ncbi:MAG: hypothetical protein ABI614_28660 [Planctomycetota bacterium]